MAAVLMESGATGWAQETRREPGYLPAISRPVRPARPPGDASNDVELRELHGDDDAEQRGGNVAEGAAAPQVDWDFTEKTVNLVDIAAHAALTRQQLTDVPEVEGVVNSDLPLMVRQKTEADVVAGTGNANQMTGLLTWAKTKAYTLGEKPANAGPSDFLVDFHKAIEKLEVESYVSPEYLGPAQLPVGRGGAVRKRPRPASTAAPRSGLSSRKCYGACRSSLTRSSTTRTGRRSASWRRLGATS